MIMKKMRSVLMALLLTVCGVAMADGYAYLTIGQNTGDTEVALNNISKITFDETNMILNMTDGTRQSLPLAGLSKMFFSDGSTGIAATGNSNQTIRLVNGVIHVQAPLGSVVTLYNVNGQMVKRVVVDAADTAINVSDMTRGAYIVKVGNEARKIMNK
jgi:hypothetical protein